MEDSGTGELIRDHLQKFQKLQFVVLALLSALLGLSIPSSNEYAAIVPPNIVPSDATNIVVGETPLHHGYGYF